MFESLYLLCFLSKLCLQVISSDKKLFCFSDFPCWLENELKAFQRLFSEGHWRENSKLGKAGKYSQLTSLKIKL